ncbi:MAG: hypothetical protein ACK4RV_17855 [Caulobacter sp.]
MTHADPAWFETLPRRRPCGAREPDYGRVFWTLEAEGAIAWWFDRAATRFCRLTRGPIPADWLVSQGRAFRIAGRAGR